MFESESINTFYSIEYPVLSFDIWNDKLIAIIYQVEGANKLTIRDIHSNKENYYLDIKGSYTKVLVRFLIDENILLYYDGIMVYSLSIKENKHNILAENINECYFDYKTKKIFARSMKGDIFHWTESISTLIYSNLNKSISTSSDTFVLRSFCYASKNDMLLVAEDYKINIIDINNQYVVNMISTNFEKVKFIFVDDQYNYIGVIGLIPKGIFLYNLDENKPYLNDQFNEGFTNYSQIIFISDLKYFILCSNIGYITIYKLENAELLFSAQIHQGLIRDFIYINNNILYLSGDDGHVSRLMIK